jgi:hypothetical protein
MGFDEDSDPLVLRTTYVTILLFSLIPRLTSFLLAGVGKTVFA